jgi:hypothetical protein
MSDHNTLLCTEQEQIQKSKQFCFETAWIRHADFIPKIKAIWSEEVLARNAAGKWCIKLNRVKKFLKGWGINLRGHTKRYKMMLKKELSSLEENEEEGTMPANFLDRKTFIQTELMKTLEEEELYWHKRSNENWLLQGDNNTEYFHKNANRKKRKNIIFNMEKDDGNISKYDDIVKHATEYYKELFGPSESPTFSLNPDCWDQNEKITEEENNLLTRQFS